MLMVMAATGSGLATARLAAMPPVSVDRTVR